MIIGVEGGGGGGGGHGTNFNLRIWLFTDDDIHRLNWGIIKHGGNIAHSCMEHAIAAWANGY